MKKPHEQEWRNCGGPCRGRIVNEDDVILADEIEEDALPLMLAAPDMARALLSVFNTAGFSDWLARADPEGTQAADALDALRKAGVVL